jgi:hypothetical protein
MSKRIEKIIEKGRFTPKERAFFLIHDRVKKSLTGEGDLSDIFIDSLSSWTPDLNEEAAEYNKWIRSWKLAVFAEVDAQTIFLKAQLALCKDDKAFSKYYAQLLAFKDLFEKLSSTFHIELPRVKRWLKELPETDVKPDGELADLYVEAIKKLLGMELRLGNRSKIDL